MRLIKLAVVFLLFLEFALPAMAADYQFDPDAYNAALLRGAYDSPAPPPSPKYSYDITAHSNCVLEHSKGTQTPIQVNRISTACRHKATPKNCRNVSAMPPDNESKSPQEICVDECKSAGMWSRKYGDCSLD